MESVEQIINIDSVWAGHPLVFRLLTHQSRQYIAYYNTNRNMVVGQRNLEEDKFLSLPLFHVNQIDQLAPNSGY
jgi:hypothetical protein